MPMSHAPIGLLAGLLLTATAHATPTLTVESTSTWSGGFGATLSIDNPAGEPAINGWTIQWTGGVDIQSLWNGLWSTDGTAQTITNEAWNGTIAPGGTHQIGFTAAGAWPPSFPDATFNGEPIIILGSTEDPGGGDDPTPPACPGDVDLDGAVDVDDVLALMQHWGACDGCEADVNLDGQVGVADLLILLAAWGDCDDIDPGPQTDQRIVAYYIEWGIYGRDFQPSDIPWDRITHLNYAFANISEDGRIAIGDPYAAIDKTYPGDTWDQPYRGTYNQINNVYRAQYPHIRTLISVGGWTWSGRFSDVALTPESRAIFTDSCVEFIRMYNFDGVDIDWEYPVCCGLEGNTYRPEDRENYTLLMQDLRTALDAAEAEDGRAYLLTIAAAGGVDKLDNYDMPGIAASCDWINTMSYDFMGAWDLSLTGHHAGLHANPNNPSPNENVRMHYNVGGSVQPWIDAGVAPEKIVVGVPFYGRAWGGVGSTNNGLFQSGSVVPPGTWDDWSSGATGVNDFTEIETMLAGGAYTRFWDDHAKVPWLYSPSEHGGHFISYDDGESMQIKMDWVNQQELGGVMFWEITADRNNTLLDVINTALSVE